MPSLYKLTDSFPYLLNRVGVRMGELFSQRVSTYGVTLPMYRVMAAIWESPGQRLNDLSTMTTIEISTLSRLVGNMEKLDFVLRRRLEDNARTVAIHLTERGEQLVQELMPIAQHFEEVAVSGLSAANLKVMKKSLVTVYESLNTLESELKQLRLKK